MVAARCYKPENPSTKALSIAKSVDMKAKTTKTTTTEAGTTVIPHSTNEMSRAAQDTKSTASHQTMTTATRTNSVGETPSEASHAQPTLTIENAATTVTAATEVTAATTATTATAGPSANLASATSLQTPAESTDGHVLSYTG